MTLDLAITLACITLIIGFVLGATYQHLISRKEREKDAGLIEVLRGLVATLSGRRYDDEA